MNEPSHTAVTEPQMPAAQAGAPAGEGRDERLPWPRLAGYAAAALLAFAAAAGGAVALQYRALGSLRDDRAIAGKRVREPQLGIVEPRLIEAETRAAELAALRRRQLEEWGWVDRERRLVRMPIERAMRQVAEGRR